MWTAKYFSLAEMVHSDVALQLHIKNEPTPEQLENLIHTANCMDAIRVFLGRPVYVTNAFRSKPLNVAVGGAKNSQHMDGEAVDWVSLPQSPLEICKLIAATRISFDQLINEGRWIHTSFKRDAKLNRREVLTAVRVAGKATSYRKGL